VLRARGCMCGIRYGGRVALIQSPHRATRGIRARTSGHPSWPPPQTTFYYQSILCAQQPRVSLQPFGEFSSIAGASSRLIQHGEVLPQTALVRTPPPSPPPVNTIPEISLACQPSLCQYPRCGGGQNGFRALRPRLRHQRKSAHIFTKVSTLSSRNDMRDERC
jgi:hypothetical protein